MSNPDDPSDKNIADPETPESSEANDAIQVAEGSRGSIEGNLKTHQLPNDLWDRLNDMELGEYRESIEQEFRNINHFLAYLHQAHAFEAEAEILSGKIEKLSGENIYKELCDVIDEMNQLFETIAARISASDASGYLLHVSENDTGTLIGDMEVDWKKMNAGKEVYRDITSINVDSPVNPDIPKMVKNHDNKCLAMMDQNIPEMVASFMVQDELRMEIMKAFKDGKLDEDTAKLLLVAAAGQLDHIFNGIGQKSVIFDYGYKVKDLGEAPPNAPTSS